MSPFSERGATGPDKPGSPDDPSPPAGAGTSPTGAAPADWAPALGLLAEGGAVALFDVNFKAGTASYSPAWLRLLGYGPGEIEETYDGWLELLHPEDSAAGPHDAGRRTAIGTHAFDVEFRLRHKAGRWMAVQCVGVQRIDADGEIERVSGFILDASDRLAEPAPPPPRAKGGSRPGSTTPFPGGASPAPGDSGSPGLTAATTVPAAAPGGGEAGQPSPEALRQALGALAEGILVADARGTVVLANDTALRLMGLASANAVGRPLADVFRLVRRDDGSPGEDPAVRAAAAIRPLPVDTAHALATPEGGPLPIAWTARAVVSQTGTPGGVILVFRDPNEMNLSPDELVRAAGGEMLTTLARGIASDLNDLLTKILAGVTLARDAQDPAALPAAETACLAARDLTRRLLDLSAGNVTAAGRVPCQPAELLKEAAATAAAGTGTLIETEIAPDAGQILGDRAQLLQVFRDLIRNAIESFPPPPHRGRIVLHASAARIGDGEVPALPGGDYAVLEIRDNGAGIPPENLGRIWEPFFSTKPNRTGLGLASVLSIVRRHAGRVAVESAPGTGSAFTVYLPAAAPGQEVRAHRAASARFGTGRILVMDDDEEICALTGSMLQSLDYKFDLARRGEDAIALYRRYLNIGRPYDVVILDLTVVGGMGGDETFLALRELDPDVRAIVSTGYDDDKLVRKHLDMGFSGFLSKPYRAAELGRVIKTITG